MASYPSAVKSFTTKQNGANQVIDASHVNDLQDEVAAVESGLLNGLQHGLTVSTGGLTVSTGAATFGDQVRGPAQPRCLVHSTVAQQLAQDVYTAVSFTGEDFDVGGLHSTGTNPSRITIPAGSSGVYLFGMALFFSSASLARANARFVKNSTTEVGITYTTLRSSVAAVVLSAQQPIVMDGGDYVEVDAMPDGSTGSIITAPSGIRRLASQFWCTKLW